MDLAWVDRGTRDLVLANLVSGYHDAPSFINTKSNAIINGECFNRWAKCDPKVAVNITVFKGLLLQNRDRVLRSMT